MNTLLMDAISESEFRAKDAEFKAEAEQVERSLAELGETNPVDIPAALALFDLAQNASEIYRGSKITEKRELLQTLSLNRTLGDLSLVLQKRKPFDLLAERPEIQQSRGNCRIFEPYTNLVRGIVQVFVDERPWDVPRFRFERRRSA